MATFPAPVPLTAMYPRTVDTCHVLSGAACPHCRRVGALFLGSILARPRCTPLSSPSSPSSSVERAARTAPWGLYQQLAGFGRIKPILVAMAASANRSLVGSNAVNGAAIVVSEQEAAAAAAAAAAYSGLRSLLELVLVMYLDPDTRCDALRKTLLGVLTTCDKAAPAITSEACRSFAASWLATLPEEGASFAAVIGYCLQYPPLSAALLGAIHGGRGRGQKPHQTPVVAVVRHAVARLDASIRAAGLTATATAAVGVAGEVGGNVGVGSVGLATVAAEAEAGSAPQQQETAALLSLLIRMLPRVSATGRAQLRNEAPAVIAHLSELCRTLLSFDTAGTQTNGQAAGPARQQAGQRVGQQGAARHADRISTDTTPPPRRPAPPYPSSSLAVVSEAAATLVAVASVMDERGAGETSTLATSLAALLEGPTRLSFTGRLAACRAIMDDGRSDRSRGYDDISGVRVGGSGVGREDGGARKGGARGGGGGGGGGGDTSDPANPSADSIPQQQQHPLSELILNVILQSIEFLTLTQHEHRCANVTHDDMVAAGWEAERAEQRAEEAVRQSSWEGRRVLALQGLRAWLARTNKCGEGEREEGGATLGHPAALTRAADAILPCWDDPNNRVNLLAGPTFDLLVAVLGRHDHRAPRLNSHLGNLLTRVVSLPAKSRARCPALGSILSRVGGRAMLERCPSLIADTFNAFASMDQAGPVSAELVLKLLRATHADMRPCGDAGGKEAVNGATETGAATCEEGEGGGEGDGGKGGAGGVMAWNREIDTQWRELWVPLLVAGLVHKDERWRQRVFQFMLRPLFALDEEECARTRTKGGVEGHFELPCRSSLVVELCSTIWDNDVVRDVVRGGVKSGVEGRKGCEGKGEGTVSLGALHDSTTVGENHRTLWHFSLPGEDEDTGGVEEDDEGNELEVTKVRRRKRGDEYIRLVLRYIHVHVVCWTFSEIQCFLT